MEHLERWHDLFVLLGSSSAVIAGLCVLAASVRTDQLTTPYWRVRTRNSTLGLLLPTICSVFALAPQSEVALGWQMLALNVAFVVCFPGVTFFHAFRNEGIKEIRVPLIAIAIMLVAAAGGLGLVFHWPGGLWLIVSAHCAGLLGGVLNVYGILVPRE
jgi:hypothetical protein